MSVHVVYMREYIHSLLKELDVDKDFIIQGLAPLKDTLSKKDLVELQWCMVKFSHALDETMLKLRLLDDLVAKFEQKGNSAGTKI